MHEYRFLRFPGGKPKAVTFSYDDGPNMMAGRNLICVLPEFLTAMA